MEQGASVAQTLGCSVGSLEEAAMQEEELLGAVACMAVEALVEVL